ncbi:MAG: glycosyltransferase, partial [Nanoarchaeota archaeon]|nr:glycosyltransferase [Nanoarchaeota archaeon]
MQLSIVVPVYNEEESLPELEAWVDKVCKKEKIQYEIFLIDDGSTDNSWNVILSLIAKNNCVKGLRFRRNMGKSAAL